MRESDVSVLDRAAPARRRRRRRPLLIALVSLIVLALAAGGVATYYFKRFESALTNVQQDNLMPAPYAGQPAKTPSEAMNVLLVGADKNDDGSDGRSDVLMLAHLSGDQKSVYLISFPRDLWVDIAENAYVPRRAKAKINAAYSWGRAPLTVRTIEELTQTRIDHTAEINFGGFVDLTEQLGGVSVNNLHASQSGGYTFPQGAITIRGEEALAYVRQRHGLPNGDLDRAERQRAVLSGIINKVTSPEVVANPAKFGAMLDLLFRQVTVDQTLPTSEVKRLVFDLQGRERSQVHSLQVPITGLGTSADGQSIVLVDEPRLAELSKALREDTMADYVARNPN
ncbi:MAG: LCP family protein [Propionibacteriaceae bacterium]|nr:LCP family protein [Propionibacteriaceae bacterium]